MLSRGVDPASRPPAPLILSGHWATRAEQKHTRFVEQLEWAREMDRLEDALKYSEGLKPDDWMPLDPSEWRNSPGSL